MSKINYFAIALLWCILNLIFFPSFKVLLKMFQKPSFLFVLTSQAILPSRGTPTGWYLPELVHPYNKLAPYFNIVVASPAGGEAPLDSYSIEATKDDAECQAFLKEQKNVWVQTVKLSSLLGKSAEFAGIFYVGGHGRELASFPGILNTLHQIRL